MRLVNKSKVRRKECSICALGPEVAARINSALFSGASQARAAKLCGKKSGTPIRRHIFECLSRGDRDRYFAAIQWGAGRAANLRSWKIGHVSDVAQERELANQSFANSPIGEARAMLNLVGADDESLAKLRAEILVSEAERAQLLKIMPRHQVEQIATFRLAVVAQFDALAATSLEMIRKQSEKRRVLIWTTTRAYENGRTAARASA
jgi:hypothetical protein